MVEIYRNPGRWRAVVHTNEVRHGTAGCLLSLVLLAPLFVKPLGMACTMALVAFYSFFVVPAAATHYFSPAKFLLNTIKFLWSSLAHSKSFKLTSDSAVAFVRDFLTSLVSFSTLLLKAFVTPFYCLVYCVIPSLHQMMLSSEAVRNGFEQVSFFWICGELLLPSGRRFISFSFLLFYYTLDYIFTSLVERRWSTLEYNDVRMNVPALVSRVATVRLSKTVVGTLVLLLGTERMKNYNEDVTVSFVALTAAFFWYSKISKESDFLARSLQNLNLKFSDDDQFWIPYLSKVASVTCHFVLFCHYSVSKGLLDVIINNILLTICCAASVLFEEQDYSVLVQGNFRDGEHISPPHQFSNKNFLLSSRDTSSYLFSPRGILPTCRFYSFLCCIGYFYWLSILTLKQQFEKWTVNEMKWLDRDASIQKKESFRVEAPTCPICLEFLESAIRKTPCGHLFHWKCIKRCLEISNSCPMCKSNLRNR